MPFTRVGGISHVIGGGDCPRRHNSRIKGGDCPRLAKQSQLYSPVFCGMPGLFFIDRQADRKANRQTGGMSNVFEGLG